MAHEYTTWAYKQDLPCAMKFVLVALADRANQEGFCWPSNKDISAMTGQSDRSVVNQINALVEKGYLEKSKRYRKDGYRASNGYTLLKNRDLFLDETVSHENISHEPISHENDDNSYMNDVQGNIYPTDISEPSGEPSKAKANLFDEFWTAYPRKVKKKRCEKLYPVILKTTPHETIMAGLEKYKTGKPDYADWQHPSTWLKDEGWNDEYEQGEKNNGTNSTNNTADEQKQSSLDAGEQALRQKYGLNAGRTDYTTAGAH